MDGYVGLPARNVVGPKVLGDLFCLQWPDLHSE